MSDRQFTSDDLLIEVMDDLMNEEVAAVPTERQIAAMHTWSDEHKEEMDYILKHGRRRFKEAEKVHFYGMNRWATQAAAIVLILVVGSVAALSTGIFGSKKNAAESAAITEEAEAADEMKTESAAAGDIAESKIEEYAAEEAPAEPAAPLPMQNSGDFADDKGICEGVPSVSESSGSDEITFGGLKLHRAYEQKIASAGNGGKISISVEDPIINAKAEEITLSLSNKETYGVRYYQDMEIDVLVDGIWYGLTAAFKEEGEGEEYMSLIESGETNEEVIDISGYDLDRNAEKYRVVVYFDGQILASEFEFEK